MALVEKLRDVSDTQSMMIEGADKVVHLEETGKVEAENLKYGSLISHIKSMFERAKNRKRSDEQRWLTAVRNYRGTYGPDVAFTSTEKSRVFIKITKTKVLAAYAQVTDVLFAGNKFPIGIEPTQMPLGIEETVHVKTGPKPQGLPPSGAATTASGKSKSELSSTVSRKSILEALGPLTSLADVKEEDIKIGAGTEPTDVTYNPAAMAAKMMEKAIHDQLEESQASKHLRAVAFEMSLLGTGIIKGPFADTKEYPKWSKEGKYVPEFQTIPAINHVSVWNAYPDPDARNMNEAEWFIERHRFSRSQLRDLKRRPFFREESIDIAIGYGENYTEEYWENTIQDNYTDDGQIDRFEVLEYWGMVDKELAEDCDLKIPSELKDKDQFQINAWVCNNQVLRLVLNPFTPSRIPYHAVPYEVNPYSFFGIGLAENMEDTQLLMNGFMRMAVDNAALSGNILVEVNEDMLSPGQDLDVYPGKVFRRSGGAPGQSIFGTSFPNVSQENMMMFDKARQLADESTGMPSYAHGGTGVTGVGKTASGMSMLMGAAAQNIKAVVRNVDDYLLTPMGKDFFSFNMQFNFKEAYTEGDLEVIPRGTESLMRNEVRSQKLLQLLQTGLANPATAPLMNTSYILREIAASMELEEDKLVFDPREAMLQAKLINDYKTTMGDANPEGAAMAAGGAPNINDPTGTGNGNIAPGAAPEPGAAGFTGAGGATGAGAQANADQAATQPPPVA